MGIKGLSKLFKDYYVKKHISQFKGSTIGIDGLSWAYKGFYSLLSCNLNGMNKIIQYYSKILRVFEKYKIKPIIIFDGKILKCKEKTKILRENERLLDEKKYYEEIENGDKFLAQKFKSKSQKLSEEYITNLIYFLKNLKIEVIVAPYESDSQLLYLEKIKYIDYIVTEDSDLILLGAKNILFKLSIYGEIEFYSREKIKKNLFTYNIFEESKNTDFHLKKLMNFEDKKRIFSGVLSGCDYGDTIKGLGIKTSIELVNKLDSFNNIIKKLFDFKRIKDNLTEEFIWNIMFCILPFIKQIVYCPIKKSLVRLEELDENKLTKDEKKILEFYGGEYFKDFENLVNGIISPITMKKKEAPNQKKLLEFKNIFSKTKINKTFLNLLNYGKIPISSNYIQETEESNIETDLSDDVSKLEENNFENKPILINNLTLEINYNELNQFNYETEKEYNTIKKINKKKNINWIPIKKKKIAKLNKNLKNKIDNNIEKLLKFIN